MPTNHMNATNAASANSTTNGLADIFLNDSWKASQSRRIDSPLAQEMTPTEIAIPMMPTIVYRTGAHNRTEKIASITARNSQAIQPTTANRNRTTTISSESHVSANSPINSPDAPDTRIVEDAWRIEAISSKSRYTPSNTRTQRISNSKTKYGPPGKL